MSNPKLTAKLFETENKQHITLRADEEAIKAIAQTEKSDVTCEDVLFGPSFDVTYNKYHVIINFARNSLILIIAYNYSLIALVFIHSMSL